MTPSEKYIKSMQAKKKAQAAAGVIQTKAQPAVLGTPSPPRGPAARYIAAMQKVSSRSSTAKTNHEENPWEEIEDACAGLRGLDVEARVEHKKAMLERFLPIVTPLLEAQSQGSKESSRVIVWLADVGRMDAFWRLSEQAMGLGWPAPFKTDWSVFRLDCVRAWAEKQLEAESDPGAFVDLAIAALEQAPKAPSQLKAKLYKLAGKMALQKNERDEAQTLLTKALEYDPKCGCIGLLKQAQAGPQPPVVNTPTAPHGQAVRQAGQGG